jgi:hypothetical protein
MLAVIAKQVGDPFWYLLFGFLVWLFKGILIASAFAAPLVAINLLEKLRDHRRRRRVVDGLCPHCGYDMRATPRRCPECGNVRELCGNAARITHTIHPTARSD